MTLYFYVLGLILAVFAIMVGLRWKSGIDKLVFVGGMVTLMCAGYGLLKVMGGE